MPPSASAGGAGRSNAGRCRHRSPCADSLGRGRPSAEAGVVCLVEARAIADSVMQYQSADGGWPKNTDLGTPPPPAASRAAAGADVTSSTIDNNGTTMPMQFLALMAHATGEARYRAVVPSRLRLPARRAVSQRRLAAVLSAAPGVLLAHHLQRQRDGQRADRPARRRGRQGALRLRGRGPPREGPRGRGARDRRHPEDAGETERQADGVVRAARREDARAGVGAHLRAAVALRQRERRHRPLPDGDREADARDRRRHRRGRRLAEVRRDSGAAATRRSPAPTASGTGASSPILRPVSCGRASTSWAPTARSSSAATPSSAPRSARSNTSAATATPTTAPGRQGCSPRSSPVGARRTHDECSA